MSDHYVCEHGSLHRKCEICERDERIKELEDRLSDLHRPTHGPCCTCQHCGKFYGDCRCDLDRVADELTKAEQRIKELERERDEARKALIWFALEPEIFEGTPNWVQASVIAARAAEGGEDE